MNLLDATANSVNTIFAQLIAKAGVRERRRRWRTRWGSRATGRARLQAGVRDHARLGRLHAARAHRRLRDDRVGRDPPRSAGVRDRARAEREGARQDLDTGASVLSPNVAAELTYAMQGVIQYGTGTAANLGRPAAGKTGTAENFQDAWFCGFVPQLATCVWVGYPEGEIPLHRRRGRRQVCGGTLPAEIWRDFMAPAVAPLPVKNFPTPDSSAARTSPATGRTPTRSTRPRPARSRACMGTRPGESPPRARAPRGRRSSPGTRRQSSSPPG